MNIVLWIVAILLALAFLAAGTIKLTRPKEQLEGQMGWVEDFDPWNIKVIAILEILAGIGLILPALTGILPWLTPLAAVGLVLVMLGAILTHARRQEYPMIIGNVVLLALAVIVAYGRFVLVPL